MCNFSIFWSRFFARRYLDHQLYKIWYLLIKPVLAIQFCRNFILGSTLFFGKIWRQPEAKSDTLCSASVQRECLSSFRLSDKCYTCCIDVVYNNSKARSSKFHPLSCYLTVGLPKWAKNPKVAKSQKVFSIYFLDCFDLKILLNFI